MTKILFTIITAFFSVHIIYAQENYSTASFFADYSDNPVDLTSEKRGYKGSVKSVITKQYDENTDKYYIVDFSKYDSDGNIIEGREFDSIGEVQLITTYKYDNGQCSEYKVDSSGTLIDHFSIRYNSSGKMTEAIDRLGGEKMSFKYNSNDSLAEAVSVEADGSQVKYTYEYDSDGNLIALTDYTDGDVYWKEIYEYDSEGNKILTKSGDHEDSLTTRLIYTYDADGNMIKQSNVFGSYTTYAYDSDGNLIAELEYEDDTLFQKLTYKYSGGNKVEFLEIGYVWDNGSRSIDYQSFFKYDDAGNIIEEKEFEGGRIDWHYLYKYAADGNVIEELEFEGDKIVWHESFIYDSYGNITETLLLTDGFDDDNQNDDDENSENITCSYKYEYDSYGNIIKARKISMYSWTNVDRQYEFTYY